MHIYGYNVTPPPHPSSVYVFAFLSFDVFTQLFQRFKLENISFTPFYSIQYITLLK